MVDAPVYVSRARCANALAAAGLGLAAGALGYAWAGWRSSLALRRFRLGKALMAFPAFRSASRSS